MSMALPPPIDKTRLFNNVLFFFLFKTSVTKFKSGYLSTVKISTSLIGL